MPGRFGWRWLTHPETVVLETALDPKQCFLRLLDKVHCEGLAPADAEVVGSVTSDGAWLKRLYRVGSFSRSPPPDVSISVSMAGIAHGSRLDCACDIGIGTVFQVAAPFSAAIVFAVWALVADFSPGGLLAAIGVLALFGLFATAFAPMRKNAARDDAEFLLAFLRKVLTAHEAEVGA